MIIRLPVYDGRIDVAPNSVELQLAVDVVAEDIFQIFLRRSRVEPCVVIGLVEDCRLPVVGFSFGSPAGWG
ncbi:hypothetical protein A9K72_33305 [Mesorhizobium loti]|nr:hypothetical protein A9174_14715 [Mesorhizobium loti NZP2037]ANN62149.1 hypothetical protein A9174_35245 [Mesorhizobium loti NZP2037]OBQ70203.1 hypothetical protein A9K72_33305 [Mesorhizobium loti]